MTRLLALVALLALPRAAAPPLRGPVDVDARRAAVGKPFPSPTRTPVAQPIRDLQGYSYYVDYLDAHAAADSGLKTDNDRVFKPLRAYVARVATLADCWVQSLPANADCAKVAVESLAGWARADALLGTANQQGRYERTWTLASLALSYLKVRDAPGLGRPDTSAVESWLSQIARLVRAASDQAGRMSGANNHAYWAGLAVAAAGAAAQDRGLFDWGLSRARVGIAQVRADGFLPLELERKALALHYHLFALAPLVMTAELAAANGTDLYKEGNRAIQRLADRVIAGLADPAPFATATGVTQQVKSPPRGPDLAWAEAYFARFHDRRLASLLAAARPLRDDRLGGDLTASFGVPDLR
ncbi:MAG TPA: alginate lyase family protein [Polyangia bacterium]